MEDDGAYGVKQLSLQQSKILDIEAYTDNFLLKKWQLGPES